MTTLVGPMPCMGCGKPVRWAKFAGLLLLVDDVQHGTALDSRHVCAIMPRLPRAATRAAALTPGENSAAEFGIGAPLGSGSPSSDSYSVPGDHTNRRAEDMEQDVVDFASAWAELRPLLRTLRVPDRYDQRRMVKAKEVRITLRKTTGQWLAQLGPYNGTGETEGLALRTLLANIKRAA